MIKRYGEHVDPKRRYQMRPGVYAVLARGDAVLLTHQAEPLPELQLPGGGVDPGEHPVSALHREVFEETGYTVAGLRRLGAFRRFTYMVEYDLWAEKVCTIYLARPGRRIGPPAEAAHMPVWLPMREAIEALENDGDRAFMRRVLTLNSRL